MTTTRPPALSRRSGLRRPIPPLIFLLVLAVLALGVWWRVLQGDLAQQAAAEESCTTAPAASAAAIDPASVRIRVYNATDRTGLANAIGTELGVRGFTVAEIANDNVEREVLGIGEVRHGPRGGDQARLVAAHFLGLTPVRDTRADGSIDVAVGPDFDGMTPPEQVPDALAAAEAQARASAVPDC
ncbi:hypothetical protein BH20ACT5_BH20ACT5_20790 [soil metagenome]